MPLNNEKCPQCNECHGFQWHVRNQDKLASLISSLLVGRYRHVEKIIASSIEDEIAPKMSTAGINDLVRKLEVHRDVERHHRDGWIFQMITWIAAKLVDPSIMSAPPQSQPAQPGLDNLFVIADQDKVIQVIIGEDKATVNERKTITDKVWPEIKDFETGRRDHELLNEITPILERNSAEINVDACLKELFWEQIRHYRVCITVSKCKDGDSRKALFKGFNKVATGKINKRRAETFVMEDIRAWMDTLCKKITTILREHNV